MLAWFRKPELWAAVWLLLWQKTNKDAKAEYLARQNHIPQILHQSISICFHAFLMCAAAWGAAARHQICVQILCGTLMYSGLVTITMQWHLFRFTFTCPNKLLTFALKMHLPRCNWTRRYDFYVCADARYRSWSGGASEANRFFTPIHNNKRQSSKKRRWYFSMRCSLAVNL